MQFHISKESLAVCVRVCVYVCVCVCVSSETIAPSTMPASHVGSTPI